MGNSKGVRIPKPILEQLALGEEVELSVRGDQLVIRPGKRSRSGWEDQFQRMAERGDDRLLDEETASSTKWDQDEWEWK
jgi:antitoxin MazE